MGDVVRGLWDLPGRLWGVSGGPWRLPRRRWGLLRKGQTGTENTYGFLRVSVGGSMGVPWGAFWSSSVVLGTVLGSGKIHISLVLMLFLRSVCVCVCVFFFRQCNFFLVDRKTTHSRNSDPFGRSTCSCSRDFNTVFRHAFFLPGTCLNILF